MVKCLRCLDSTRGSHPLRLAVISLNGVNQVFVCGLHRVFLLRALNLDVLVGLIKIPVNSWISFHFLEECGRGRGTHTPDCISKPDFLQSLGT